MRIRTNTLPLSALALSLALGCQAGDDLNAEDLAIDQVASSEDDNSVISRAMVVDGVIVLYAEDGKTSEIDLGVEVVDVHGIVGERLLIGASPRPLLPGSDELGGHDLYSVDLEGGDLRQLSFGQEVVRAEWSEAAGRVLVSTRSMELIFIDLDSPSEFEILVDHAITPALSADGELLAYGRLPDDWSPGSLPESIDLHLLDLKAGSDRELTTGFDDIEPIWSPDGESLLFLSGARTGIHSFWEIEVGGGAPDQLTNIGAETVNDSFVPSPSSNTEVEWSADGATLLYGAHYSEVGEVHALHFAADGAPTLLSFGSGQQPQWTGEGTISALAITSSSLDVVAIDLQSGDREVRQSLAGTLTTPLSRVAERAQSDENASPSMAEIEAMMNPGDGTTERSSVRFQLPMNNYYGINFHYDNDAGWGLRDKNCGTQTYNGHKGTDFTANYGNTIYTAAAGSIYQRNDGCATTGYYGNWCGNGFGNHVRMDHGGNWKTIYGHMTNGTVTGYGWRNCGAYLGVSGSSGNSTGAHLHFEVQRYGYPNDDPFSGQCSGPESYWTANWQCQW